MSVEIEKKIRGALGQVLAPGVARSLVRMNLVRGIEVKDGKAKIILASAGIPAQSQDWVREKVITAIRDVPEVRETTVEFIEAKPKELNQIQQVIAVMSGKGGVGKSLVASLLAASFAREGKDVGILDADITGPSIPKMFGLNEHPSGSEGAIL
ncbi:MAG TPA: P-loop NTPase, partial [Dehalococcoidia bacterium]|nr:P-loop NTPase [Dehalococcoidia bacterium]